MSVVGAAPLVLLQHEDIEPLIARLDARFDDASDAVKPIIDDVRRRGDEALAEYALRFDGIERASLLASQRDLANAVAGCRPELIDALERSIRWIADWSASRMPHPVDLELPNGTRLREIIRPISRVACYVPGGAYPMVSTVIHAAVPAMTAGVPEVWVTTPRPVQETLAAARLVGIERVAFLGGAHAIAAFAFGTQTIPKVDKIVGPGNRYVAAAKRALAGEVAIEFVAGPTETVIVSADGRPDWIAGDLIAQAEHDRDAVAILITPSRRLAEAVIEEVDLQLKALPCSAIPRESLRRNAAAIVTQGMDQAMDIVNRLAPEHLCLHDPTLLDQVAHCGTIYVGEGTPEAAGDYVLGASHVLPTSGQSRTRGGLSPRDFVKVISVQSIKSSSLTNVGPIAAALARAEGLEGHARAIESRMASRGVEA